MASTEPPITWHTINPADAVGLDLRERLDITAPLNEEGARCPWPWDPQQHVGAPLGQYHCPHCGAMVLAGQPHLDYAMLDDVPAGGPAPATTHMLIVQLEDDPSGWDWPPSDPTGAHDADRYGYTLTCPGVTDTCRVFEDCLPDDAEQEALDEAAGPLPTAHGKRHTFYDNAWMAETDRCLYVGHDQLPEVAGELRLGVGTYPVLVRRDRHGDLVLAVGAELDGRDWP